MLLIFAWHKVNSGIKGSKVSKVNSELKLIRIDKFSAHINQNSHFIYKEGLSVDPNDVDLMKCSSR